MSAMRRATARELLSGHGTLAGIALGAAYGVVARLAVQGSADGSFLVMTLGFIVLVPVTIGYLTTYNVESPSGAFVAFAPWLTCGIAVATSVAIGLEGSICVVFAIPVMFPAASVGGWIGETTRGRSRLGRLAVLLLPWGTIAVESGLALPDRVVVTTASIEVDAPLARVWPLVTSVDSIRAAERRPAFFTTIGFPAPIAATLDHEGVGGVRTASFERGVVFHEVITDWQPGSRLSFTIDATDVPREALDPHVAIGGPFFDVLTGTYTLVPISPERTRIVLESRHRVATHFNPYAAWWAERVMGSVQRNILEVLRARAQAPVSQVTRTELLKQVLPPGNFRNVQAVTVELAPGAGAPAHRHDVAVVAYVLEGAVENQFNDGPIETHRAGESWWEAPGTAHRVVRNASQTARAKLLVVYIGEDGKPLSVPLTVPPR